MLFTAIKLALDAFTNFALNINFLTYKMLLPTLLLIQPIKNTCNSAMRFLKCKSNKKLLDDITLFRDISSVT